MKIREKRLEKIKEIINRENVRSQTDLTEKLRGSGFEVTQACVSRDLKALGFFRALDESGEYVYMTAEREEKAEDHSAGGKNLRILREAFKGIKNVGNLALIRTHPGTAQGAAAALEALRLMDIAGSVAGDDTVLVVMESEASAEELVRTINRLC